MSPTIVILSAGWTASRGSRAVRDGAGHAVTNPNLLWCLGQKNEDPVAEAGVLAQQAQLSFQLLGDYRIKCWAEAYEQHMYVDIFPV